LSRYISTSREKNALKFAYLQKALALVNSELDLLNLRIRYPEQFRQPSQPTFQSDLYILPKSKGLGIIGFVELVIGLSLLGEIYTMNGKLASLSDIAKAFEMMFNFNFGSIYRKKIALFERKPCNLTRLLDSLKNLLVKENKKKQNE
jgi:hypothetical protein